MDDKAFPKHQYGLSLTHNPHKDSLDSVERWEIESDIDAGDWISPEQRRKAIAADEFWTLDWTVNPENEESRGLIAADLDELLRAARKSV